MALWPELLSGLGGGIGGSIVGALASQALAARQSRADAAQAELTRLATEVHAARELAMVACTQLADLGKRLTDTLARLNADHR